MSPSAAIAVLAHSVWERVCDLTLCPFFASHSSAYREYIADCVVLQRLHMFCGDGFSLELPFPPIRFKRATDGQQPDSKVLCSNGKVQQAHRDRFKTLNACVDAHRQRACDVTALTHSVDAQR
jgi:hypothetical protein